MDETYLLYDDTVPGISRTFFYYEAGRASFQHREKGGRLP